MKRVLFIDRDGTLIVEPQDNFQTDSFEKLQFIPNVISSLKKIRELTEYTFVIVTNQDGLGTESFPEKLFWGPHNLMLDIFRQEGIEFLEVLIDRSFAKENLPTRKPNTGLLAKYINNPAYDLANSYVIGDRLTDVQLAKNLGCKGILIGRSTDKTDDNKLDSQALKKVIALKTNNWTAITDFLTKQEG